MPKISVILPIYNVERYLSLCLDSVRGQSFSDIEIVCVLDGSSDRSGLIARKHAACDSRIRVVEKENGGLSSARNTGILSSTGDYLVFVDSDDYLEKHACKEILRAFESNSADVVTFGANCVPSCGGNPWLVDCLSPSDAVYDCFSSDILFKEKSRPYAWRTAVRRSLLLDNDLFFDEEIAFGEDQVFHFELYPLSRKTVFLSKKLYGYRVDRAGSLMSEYASDIETRVTEHLRIVDAILAKWEKRGYLCLCPADLMDWMLEFLYVDIRNLPEGIRDSFFLRFGRMLNPELFLQAEQSLSPICRDVLRSAIEEDASILRSKRAISRYCIYREGLLPYLKGVLFNPLRSIKMKLKRVLPLPAASFQRYRDELSERVKVEQDLLMSLQLLEIEVSK